MCAQFFYNKNPKRMAFSLVEILITLLIVSLLMVSIAPILTKKLFPKQSEGLVYTYSPDNTIQTEGRCYVTSDSYDGNHKEIYANSFACSRYVFTVPQGVHLVNLTLVAGGGGGGGAEPPSTGLQAYTVSTGQSANDYTFQNSQGFTYDELKSVKINFLAAKGLNGSSGGKSTTIYGGSGGASSPVIHDFFVPVELMRGVGYVPSLTYNTDGKLIISNKSDSAYVYIGDTVKYLVKQSSSTFESNCQITNSGTTSTYKNSSDEFGSICKISNENYTPSMSGQAAASVQASESAAVNALITGGLGAVTSDIYGSGGDGASVQVISCGSAGSGKICTPTNATVATVVPAQSGKIGNASVTYEFMKEGRIGTGGAGGSMVRVVGFPVNAGETYAIYVGKGGDGGRAGKAGSEEHWIDGYVASTVGMGGTSSAIFKLSGGSETLVYMVNGGQGGYFAEPKTSSNTRVRYAGRNYPKVFSSNTSYFNYAFDSEKVSINDTVSGDSAIPTGFVAKRLTYPYLSTLPYSFLNTGMGNLLASDTSISSDNKTGGMIGFDLSTPQTSVGSMYDGLYYRAIVNEFPVYVGTSGGFSGLGGKAGCGGFFLGNFDGRKIGSSASEAEKQTYVNTFGFNTNAIYNIKDYYEGCSNLTPDGHTAEFIMPDPIAHTYGQAGAGGGGGSISAKYGAGKGGDGQNGYVMIEWRR